MRSATAWCKEIDKLILDGDDAWLQTVDWLRAGVRPERWADEEYGAVWSRRVWVDPAKWNSGLRRFPGPMCQSIRGRSGF